MKVVRVDQAGPGTRVARDVLDLRGGLLYRAGTELTSDILAQLRDRRVTHLFVQDLPAESVEVVAPPREPDRSAELDRVFADVAHLPLMVELREAAKRYLKSRV